MSNSWMSQSSEEPLPDQRPIFQPPVPNLLSNSGISIEKGAIAPKNDVIRQLDSIVSKAENFGNLLSDVAKLFLSNSDCLAVWISEKGPQDTFQKFKALSDASASDVWCVIEDHVNDMVARCTATGELLAEEIFLDSSRHLILSPVRLRSSHDSSIDFLLLALFDSKKDTASRLTWLMANGVQAITRWYGLKTLLVIDSEKKHLQEMVKLQTELSEATTLDQAARLAANQLRRILRVQQVCITINDRLVAISDVEQIDLRSESNLLIQSACQQGLDWNEAITYVPGELTPISAGQAILQSYCQANRIEACVSQPLQKQASENRIGFRAGLLIADSARQIGSKEQLDRFAQISERIVSQLRLAGLVNRSTLQLLGDRALALTRHRWRKIVVVSAIVIVALLSMPLPYRIACDCELQPVSRRFVVAPFESVLEKSVVRKGELVLKDQVLAVLDGRMVRIELAGCQAEWNGAKKRYDAELADGNIAMSQIARSEMDRLKSKMDLLESRITNLEIRSPLEGVVVSGDLEKAQGASLTTGQTLFEIAPLKEMIAEVAVPETEIQYAKAEMEVALKLSAFPFRTFTGRIESIHPRSEVIEDEVVFIAQVTLNNEEEVLRPGMKGTAKIESDWSPLGWNLFHRPWESVRYWMIW